MTTLGRVGGLLLVTSLIMVVFSATLLRHNGNFADLSFLMLLVGIGLVCTAKPRSQPPPPPGG